jgi:hypothetical protein
MDGDFRINTLNVSELSFKFHHQQVVIVDPSVSVKCQHQQLSADSRPRPESTSTVRGVHVQAQGVRVSRERILK